MIVVGLPANQVYVVQAVPGQTGPSVKPTAFLYLADAEQFAASSGAAVTVTTMPLLEELPTPGVTEAVVTAEKSA